MAGINLLDTLMKRASESNPPAWVSRLTLLISLAGFIAGGLISAGPAWREARRAWLAWCAPEIWHEAVNSHTSAHSGDPILWIYAQSADLDTLVLLDGKPDHLRDYPCLSTRGAMPGEGGPMLIQAHRDTHFRGLKKMQQDDLVSLESRDGLVQNYRTKAIEIISAEALETRFEQMQDSNQLVLITCFPFEFTGPAPYRYLVWLSPVPS